MATKLHLSGPASVLTVSTLYSLVVPCGPTIPFEQLLTNPEHHSLFQTTAATRRNVTLVMTRSQRGSPDVISMGGPSNLTAKAKKHDGAVSNILRGFARLSAELISFGNMSDPIVLQRVHQFGRQAASSAIATFSSSGDPVRTLLLIAVCSILAGGCLLLLWWQNGRTQKREEDTHTCASTQPAYNSSERKDPTNGHADRSQCPRTLTRLAKLRPGNLAFTRAISAPSPKAASPRLPPAPNTAPLRSGQSPWPVKQPSSRARSIMGLPAVVSRLDQRANQRDPVQEKTPCLHSQAL